jgi:hypothetical protein
MLSMLLFIRHIAVVTLSLVKPGAPLNVYWVLLPVNCPPQSRTNLHIVSSSISADHCWSTIVAFCKIMPDRVRNSCKFKQSCFPVV